MRAVRGHFLRTARPHASTRDAASTERNLRLCPHVPFTCPRTRRIVTSTAITQTCATALHAFPSDMLGAATRVLVSDLSTKAIERALGWPEQSSDPLGTMVSTSICAKYMFSQ